ncbi:hypothetical protein C8R45DRAFT_947010 [Mycena sanguinolenta]|nr:hypothetical protein C8R45DRAFT_947010 [Mycena sanguinolenta]
MTLLPLLIQCCLCPYHLSFPKWLHWFGLENVRLQKPWSLSVRHPKIRAWGEGAESKESTRGTCTAGFQHCKNFNEDNKGEEDRQEPGRSTQQFNCTVQYLAGYSAEELSD